MNWSSPWNRWVVPVGLLAFLLAASSRPALPEMRDAGDSTPARQGVLVELFTSQGCSSCPSADRFLSELAESEDLNVIALSFHVDYWNYIGWTDPFSSRRWSERQRRYGEAFGANRIYTPQMVIDGHLEAVGSKRSSILSLVERARSQASRARIELTASLKAVERLQVNVETENQERGSKPPEIWVAVVESGLTTPVGRGENASKTLRNDRVVRHLERVSDSRGTLEIPLEEGWRRDRITVVAFLQEAETLRVRAAAEVALAL